MCHNTFCHFAICHIRNLFINYPSKYCFQTHCVYTLLTVSFCILSTCVKVQDGRFSFSVAVKRMHWLQFSSDLLYLLVAVSSLLAAEVLHLMPYTLPSFLKCCSVGSADLLCWALLTPTAILLFLLFCCSGLLHPLLYNDF